MLDLLQERDARRAREREALRRRVRHDLRRHLGELLRGHEVFVFGSLCRAGRFHRDSDIDLAMERLPPAWSVDRLTGELSERLARPVDIVVLDGSRLADKIRREGESWTP